MARCKQIFIDAPLSNHIYQFASTLPEGIYFFNHYFMFKDRATLAVAILQSCRQIDTKANPILHSINKATSQHVPSFCSNLEKIRSKNMGFIRAIETHTALYKIYLKKMCILLKRGKKIGEIVFVMTFLHYIRLCSAFEANGTNVSSLA
ncbi:hypothetical protein AC578_3822 [Pseudocercospora eumusae]|uniref:Uncharacterized protein n=1 Tax=Pseudocercospora eumusae TaxID=321146 RepID=A0A139HFR0_9PEZI|nr:hypothetical protein AC578_3822 [Pseudocercospora eumusae]